MSGKLSQSRRYEDFKCGYAPSKWYSICRETNGFAARFMHGASITKCSSLPAYSVMHIREALLLLGQVCNCWRRLVSEFAELLTLINIVIPPDSVTPVNFCWAIPYFLCLAFCLCISHENLPKNLRVEPAYGVMCRHVQTRVVHPDFVQKTYLLPEVAILPQLWTSSRPPLNPSDFQHLEKSAELVWW